MSPVAMPQDCSKTPWNSMKILEEATHKENKCRVDKEIKAAMTASGKSFPVYSFLQVPGEQVMLDGLNRRPQLNGVRGKVVSSDMDDNGFLMVQVPGHVPAGAPSKDSEFRTLKVQPRCLKPIRGPQDGRARGGLLTELKGDQEAVSVLSVGHSTLGFGSAASVASGFGDADEVRSRTGGRFSRSASVPAGTLPVRTLTDRGFGRKGNRVTGWAGHF